MTLQSLTCSLIVVWSGWYVFGTLAPWRQRRLRAWLARRAEGILPARLVTWLRPGLPANGCGCAGGCSGVSQAPRTQGRS